MSTMFEVLIYSICSDPLSDTTFSGIPGLEKIIFVWVTTVADSLFGSKVISKKVYSIINNNKIGFTF